MFFYFLISEKGDLHSISKDTFLDILSVLRFISDHVEEYKSYWSNGFVVTYCLYGRNVLVKLKN